MSTNAGAGERDAATFLGRAIGRIMLATGIAGFVASSALMIEKIWLLEDPTHVPSCSIDAVLDCGSAMSSAQADVFGLPNPIIGIGGFAALAALGTALIAGAAFARWLWLAVQSGVTFSAIFAHWLFFEALYDLNALCPYCMVLWVASTVAFVYVTLTNLAAGRLPVPPRLSRLADLLIRNHGVVVTVWLAVLTLLIGEAFWDHWRAQF